MNPIQALPLFINHFISNPFAKARTEKMKDKFPHLHALVKQHSELHQKVLDQLKKDKSGSTNESLK